VSTPFFLVTTQCLLPWPIYTWWPASISHDMCIFSSIKALPGKKEWWQEVDTSRISRITWKMILWGKLNTWHSWTCGYVDLSSVARPMSQPWTISQWLKIWLVVIMSLLESIS
jgi:hypothetical protein